MDASTRTTLSSSVAHTDIRATGLFDTLEHLTNEDETIAQMAGLASLIPQHEEPSRDHVPSILANIFEMRGALGRTQHDDPLHGGRPLSLVEREHMTSSAFPGQGLLQPKTPKLRAADLGWRSRGYKSAAAEAEICITFSENPDYVSNYEGKKVNQKGHIKWRSTDYTAFQSDVLSQFGGCTDAVEVYYLEKAVGDAGQLMNLLTGRNMHSAVRFTGCGKTLLFQLQRSFDAIGLAPKKGQRKPFTTSWLFPVAPPKKGGKHRMLWSLVCDGRDRGNGIFIMYKVEARASSTKWKKEKLLFSLSRDSLQRFLSGFLHMIPWWNFHARYNLEEMWVRAAPAAAPQLQRPGLTCDSFSFWVLSQVASFFLNASTSKALGDIKANFNVATVDLVGGVKRLSELTEDQTDALFLQSAPANKGDVSMKWLGAKGLGACNELTDKKLRQRILDGWNRHQSKVREKIQGFGLGKRGVKEFCTEKVALRTVDMRKYSPWRFWYAGEQAGEHAYYVALDWDVKVFVKYQETYLLKAGAVIIPTGLPKGPWCTASTCKTTACGPACPWPEAGDAPTAQPLPSSGGTKRELSTALRTKVFKVPLR